MKQQQSMAVITLVLFVFVGILSGCTTQDETPAPPEYTVEEIASMIITDFDDGTFSEAFVFFNDTVAQAIDAEQLSLIWQSLTNSYGSFEGIIRLRTTIESGYTVVYVTCNYSLLGYLDTRFVFDDQDLVAGFQFVPTDLSSLYMPPSYANQSLFTEVNVTIGEEPWQLPGTLTLPITAAPHVPAVVLVHGSGPNDRDETIGPNKPFKDLAWGIASQGIAVLRYEKRTKYYPDAVATMLDTFTVQEETITDAIAAVTYLRSYPGINTSQVYVLGHSFGGYLAPRIAQQEENVTGLILLAAHTRHIEELILSQVIYLAGLDGNITADEQASINQTEEAVEQVQTLNISADEIVLGASYAYWADLASYDPIATAETLSIPLFVLQGKRDYQVTYTDDFLAWQDALTGVATVHFQTYDALNHLFIPGTGTPSNTEYNTPGNVDSQVITDIVAWIIP
ncbi:MAG: DUF3887 domain-containing protein [Candidatus Thermoplasmatota archaeon]|nr:DUF3887 domain-containing protein [Candidatus Thermoplasmatota archaeon]